MAEEQLRLQQEVPSRIERKIYQPEEDMIEENGSEHSRPNLKNFVGMILLALVLDGIGFVSDEFPGVGVVIVLIADMVLIPWMQLSGMHMNAKRLITFVVENIGESIPGVGNFPIITINVIVSYYLN